MAHKNYLEQRNGACDNDLDRSIVDGLGLKMTAAENRILVTHDVSSMPVAFARFRQAGHSPGVLSRSRSGSHKIRTPWSLFVWWTYLFVAGKYPFRRK
jgi:hypothetical protein